MIELLSPAGDKEKLTIAFHYGADAVYFGGQNYSLRANARNFSLEEIGEAVNYAHNLKKRVYVTVNIITSMQYGFSASALTNLAILITAFVLSQKSSGGTVFDTKDTSSEAAKVQAQAEKQTSIYDEQLRDGILTQEEYDQIMKSNK